MLQRKNTTIIAAWISLISNFLLTVIKITVGIMVNSQVLIADGLHNGADVIASIVAVTSTRISSIPADDDHPYGHGKAEVIASGIVGIILFGAALLVGYQSIETLLKPASEESWVAITAAFVSLIWKQILYLYTMRLGKQFNSKSLIATANDHLADVYASLAAIVGIGLALIGDHYDLKYMMYADPIAGLIVAILILRISIQMGREATEILMEKNLEPEIIEQFETLILSVPNVKRIDKIRARDVGNYVLVDIRVGVPGGLTVQEGHDTSRNIKDVIMNSNKDVQEVLVHLNPWYER